MVVLGVAASALELGLAAEGAVDAAAGIVAAEYC